MYASDVVENCCDVLVGVRFGALDRRSEEPQNETAEVEALRMRRRRWRWYL